MSNIKDLTEAWHKHSGLEVETFLKEQIGSAQSALITKPSYAEFDDQNMRINFFANEGDQQPIFTVQMGGTLYNINVDSNVPSTFYVLGDETEKIITLTPYTTQSAYGSQDVEPFPEPHSYAVYVNSGSGYIPTAISGELNVDESVSFNIKEYLSVGANYIMVAFTGLTSGFTKNIIYVATLTSLYLDVTHSWEQAWQQGSSYVINGIRFAGSIEKVLHVSVDDVEQTPVSYSANESYTTTSTTYTIPASAFPASSGSGIHKIKLWMTASGVSTKTTTYDIMCAAEGDETAMLCINSVAAYAVNFTSEPLFKYAVYGTTNAKFSVRAKMGATNYNIVSDDPVTVVAGTQYSYAIALEIPSGETSGTLYATGTAINQDLTDGLSDSADMPVDNTYSYIAAPGASFYMNASNRSNAETSTKETIINESGASTGFPATYSADFDAFNWNTDGWISDGSLKALFIPAGSTVAVPNLKPFSAMSTTGLTIEMLIKSSYPSDYDNPVLSLMDTSGSVSAGLKIYPTKLVIVNSLNAKENVVQLAENRVTHITVTLIRDYGNIPDRNLCSVYVNGIANASFSYSNRASFGQAALSMGQSKTDFYLYKMRIYTRALESQDVFNNFLNAISDSTEFNRRTLYEKNNGILEGGAISYEKVLANGFNVMVVTTPNNVNIPDINNESALNGATVRFEYPNNQSWGVSVENVKLDGQGTTSKGYFRWNLRASTSSSTVWRYANGVVTTGKSGYFAGESNHMVDRITAKKNYASSMQGHKMGLTGLYNDLYKEIIASGELPDDYRVAVYQYPFVGFQYNSANNTYTYIGLYTAGPDKGSKVTFGYDKSLYPNLLSIEGTDHDYYGTRFLHPWVGVSYSDETLNIASQSCWECSFTGGNEDDASVLAAFTAEWKPAYDLVYDCSVYIVSASEMAAGLQDISTVADLTNPENTDTIIAGSTGGVQNDMLAFYDSNDYEIYFYSPADKAYVSLLSKGYTNHNAVDSLDGYLSTDSPSTAEIIAARSAKFKAEVGTKFYVDQLLFHYCFCELFGVTDNFAKNSYPFKFNSYDASSSNRWGWRQDDLDTIFCTDNTGKQTKSYSIEVGDTVDNVPIFNGGNSALWVLVKKVFLTDITDQDSVTIPNMMVNIVNVAASEASRLHIQGNYTHESLFNLVSYYCWEKSSKYFSILMYEKDREWSYIEPWLIDPSKLYNGEHPLDQALGDQYEAERLWVERRIAYMFSKYTIGAFFGNSEGYQSLDFTLASPFTFELIPAIDLYPTGAVGQDSTRPNPYRGDRTTAGTSENLTLPAGGNTNNYLKGVEWLRSLGDLHTMHLSPRQGDSGGQISFGIEGKRLEEVIVGAETPFSTATGFNATRLSFGNDCESLLTIDARNTSTLIGTVDLAGCPRLTSALFSGSGVEELLLPTGAKLSTVSFPESCGSVYMNSLSELTNEGLSMPDSDALQALYIDNCKSLDPLELVTDILDDSDSQLNKITLYWPEALNATTLNGYLDTLLELAEGDYTDYDSRYTHPDLAGRIVSDDPELFIPHTTYFEITDTFPKINLDIKSQVYIAFEDSGAKAACVSRWDYNEDGDIELNEATSVTFMPNNLFSGQSNIVSFDEFKYFLNATYMEAAAFRNCYDLEHISLPPKITVIPTEAFKGTSLVDFDFSHITGSIGQYAFDGCDFVETAGPLVVPASSLDTYSFRFSTDKNHFANIELPNITQISNYVVNASSLTIGENVTYISSSNSVEYYFNTHCNILATIPPELNKTSFFRSAGTSTIAGNDMVFNPPIIIPAGTKNDYLESTNWSSETYGINRRLHEAIDMSTVQFVQFETMPLLPQEYTAVEYIRNSYGSGSGSYFSIDSYRPDYKSQMLLDINLGSVVNPVAPLRYNIIGVTESNYKTATHWGIRRGVLTFSSNYDRTSLDNENTLVFINSPWLDVNSNAESYINLDTRGIIKLKYNCVDFLGKKTQLFCKGNGQISGHGMFYVLGGNRDRTYIENTVMGYNLSTVKIYRISIYDPISEDIDYDDNTQYECVIDLIPCKRNYDDEYGMYDVKNGEFYSTEDAGYPFLGPEE